MASNNKKGPIIDQGICRCCSTKKKCRLLNVEYEWMGQKEVYSDMFVDTFGLLLSNLDGSPSERGVCATCVTRLRDASFFRQQVLACEQALLEASILLHGAVHPLSEVKQEPDSEPKDPTVEDNHIDDNDDMDRDVIEEETANTDEKNSETPNLPIKTETAKPKKPKVKVKKERKKVKKKSRREEKREMMMRMRLMEQKLDELQQLDEEDEMPKPTKTKPDPDHKSFQNACTIIESSYVCPFDTSFSDYFCVYCREVYTDPIKLREHTLTHDCTEFGQVANKKLPQIDITRIDCRLCTELINNIDDLKAHLKIKHGKVIHETYNEFLTFKLTANNLSCLECGAVFSFFHALKKHMAEHFGTCICDICGAHYFEERMLVLHQKSHQRVEEQFPCKDCGKTFKSKHSRNIHETRTHKKEPAYQCPKCDAVLFTYSLRYRHMIDVHGEERSFQCDHCERAYDSRKSLREHNRRFHLKIFKHQCDLCEKRFYLPSRLKEHMASHTGERNFRCEYCGKSYPRLRGLKVHMQSHITEKRYRCDLCSASFTQNVNLKNHMKRQHLDMEFRD